MRTATRRREFLMLVGSTAPLTLLRRFPLRLQAATQEAFELRDAEGRSLQVLEGGKPVLTYNYGMMLKSGVPEDRRRSCYVHPLITPGGVMITDDFPADHHHHRGLSWMWPIVEVAGERHNLWDIRGVRQKFERWVEQPSAPRSARVGVINGWYVDERRVAGERVELVIHPAAGSGRSIDITLAFQAEDQPVRLTGELGPERKGYGGLCLRFAPRTGTVITTSSGSRLKDSNLLPFPWADLSGSFAGGESLAGAAVFIDSRNPGFPNGWTLRNYGFLGVCWPGLEPYTLEPEKPVTLRYRVWVHDGAPAASEIEERFREFADRRA